MTTSPAGAARAASLEPGRFLSGQPLGTHVHCEHHGLGLIETTQALDASPHEHLDHRSCRAVSTHYGHPRLALLPQPAVASLLLAV